MIILSLSKQSTLDYSGWLNIIISELAVAHLPTFQNGALKISFSTTKHTPKVYIHSTARY
jgi:hypothetical protein